MPDNENIKYSYDLDISSLQKGTEKAIKLLQDQIDSLTGVTRQTKSAAASAKVFEKAWLKASNKIAGTQAKINKAMESAQREASKYIALEASRKAPKYVPTNIQRQIEDLVGVSTKAKSAEASARAFEKAWLNASEKVSQKNSKTTESVKQVAQAVDSGATRSQNAFTRLSQVMGNLKAPLQQAFAPITTQLGVMANMVDPNLSSKIQSFKDKSKSAFENVSGVLKQVSSAFRRTSSSTDDLGSGMQKVSKFFDKCSQKLRNLTGALNSASKSTNLLRTSIKALTAERIAEYLKNGIKQSISYVENLNLFTVAMGKSIDKGNEFVDTMQELYGMDPNNIMRYAGNFYQLATAIEMPDKAASQLSLTMTKAVNDISSLFNVDIDTVFENMSSGLQGMSRAVRKYGMDIRVTTLQTEALALGITDQVESMSEANRIGLRFIAMMKQASNASGDFAANIETPANQLRIFKEQITQLGRAIGNFFIAPLRNALQYVNGFIMAVRSVLVFIRKLLGVEVDFQTRTEGLSGGLSSTSDGISGIGDAASDTTKKLKGMLAPFDELNVLSQNAPSGDTEFSGIGSDVMDPRIAQAIEDMEYKFEDVEMKANKVRDTLLKFFGFKIDAGKIIDWDSSEFEQNLINKFPQWTNSIQAAFDNWSSIVESFKEVVSSVGDVFADAWKKYKSSFAKIFTDEKVAKFIEDLSGNFGNFAKWISDNQDTLSSLGSVLMQIVTALLALKTLAPVFNLVAGGLSSISSMFTGISNLSGALTSLSGGLGSLAGPVGLIIAGVVLLMATSEDFRNAVVSLLSDIWVLLEPLMGFLGDLVSFIVNDLLPPVLDCLESIGDALAPVITLIGDVLEALTPIVEFVTNVLSEALEFAVDLIVDLVNGLKNFFDDIKTLIGGIVDVIRGILSGDFKQIGKGLLEIFAGVLNGISGLVELVVNSVIGVINKAISFIWGLLSDFVNGIVGGVSDVIEFLGLGSISWRMDVAPPQIPKLSIPRVQVPTEFATGGVVTGPTLGIIGEADRDEAVIPLDNSPQMRKFISEIASAVDNSNKPSEPIVVKVYIGNDQLDEYIYKAQNRRDLKTNGG